MRSLFETNGGWDSERLLSSRMPWSYLLVEKNILLLRASKARRWCAVSDDSFLRVIITAATVGCIFFEGVKVFGCCQTLLGIAVGKTRLRYCVVR